MRCNGRTRPSYDLCGTTEVVTTLNPCEGDLVKWISLSAQPSRTDRRLSGMSEQVLVCTLSVERDYTLMEKRVKRGVEQEKEKGRCRFGIRIR